MDFNDIAIVILVISWIINVRNVDWKSPKTYRVSGLTLSAIALGVAILYLLDVLIKWIKKKNQR